MNPLPLPLIFATCLVWSLLSLAIVSAIAGALTKKRGLCWTAMSLGVLVVLISVGKAIAYTISASTPFFILSAAAVILAMAAVLMRKKVLYYVALAFGALIVLWIVWVAITVSRM